MSKFLCSCGHIISDSAIPNEVTGDVLSDKSQEKFFDHIYQIVKIFFNHYEASTLHKWRRDHFNDCYPQDASPAEMIHDIIHARYCNLTLAMMECEECGRLWIQEKVGVNKYKPFAPEEKIDTLHKVLGLNERSDKNT